MAEREILGIRFKSVVRLLKRRLGLGKDVLLTFELARVGLFLSCKAAQLLEIFSILDLLLVLLVLELVGLDV